MTENNQFHTDEDPIFHAIVRGEEFREWPKDLYIPPEALEVILEAFQGPLDLLLYLIRKQNLDILDIPVAQITDQYMEYVELMQSANLDLAVAFRRVMEHAAHLQSLNITREVLSVRERMTRVLNTLQNQDFVRFEALFDKSEGRMGLVVTFVAILELVKDEMITVVQNEPFTSVHIRNVA